MADSEALQKPREDRVLEQQKTSYLESYMAQQLQQKQFRYDDEVKKKQEENGCGTGYNTHPIKVPHPGSDATTFTVPDDGLGYDDGVRVLRTLGSWTPEYAGIGARAGPGMLFPELSYHHDMSAVQRKPPGLPTGPPTPISPITRPSTTPTQAIKKEISVKPNGINSSGNKSFTCTICGKSLARKDKLVIHTRIHTGEKPYVCEVCDKAFARRDKLVIHMNKMKHRTPSNVAPLGKRNADKPQLKKDEEEPIKPPLSLQTAAANWSCELCGQMMTTREEWMVHAKAHLEEKITGIGVIGHNSFGTGQRPTPAYPSAQMAGYAPAPQATNHYQPFLTERQYCPVCRQTFPGKAEFMLHVRAHFDTAVKHEEGSMDANSICSS